MQECVPLEVAAIWQTATNAALDDIMTATLILFIMLLIVIFIK